MRPQPRVRNKKAHERSHHGHTGFTQHSLRNGFNGFLRALPGGRAFLPPSPAENSASLTPASGRQDHTTSPSAPAPLVLRHHPRPSHPAPTFVTTRTPLLSRRDGASRKFDLPDGESKIFFAAGLDRKVASDATDLPVGQISWKEGTIRLKIS